MVIESGPLVVSPPTSGTRYSLENLFKPCEKSFNQFSFILGSVSAKEYHLGTAPHAARSLRATAQAL